MPVFNPDFEPDPDAKTLLELRRDLLRRLGFAAQINNPPPGMAELIDSFLQDANDQIYARHRPVRMERWFRWTMAVGERFYAVTDGDDDDEDLTLNERRISWVGVEDLAGAWTPLVRGIPAQCYTMANQPGLPQLWTLAGGHLEVFPAPDRAYTLRVKGRFGLLPFTDPTDTTSVPGRAVFLYALGNAKAHYGQNDAGNYAAQATHFIASLTGDDHQGARYIPRPRTTRSTPPRPTLTEFLD
jgi:hypothetical protein